MQPHRSVPAETHSPSKVPLTGARDQDVDVALGDVVVVRLVSLHLMLSLCLVSFFLDHGIGCF